MSDWSLRAALSRYALLVPQYRDMPPVSKGEINRCGEHLVTLHRLLRDGNFDEWFEARSHPDTARATRIVDDFRAAHQRPLSVTSVGLRQFVGTALGESPVVSQRLKRLPRIIRKLANMEGSNLARLEDIGGTRAVVDSLESQKRLCDHIEKRWESMIKRDRDYVGDPKSSGYRARHYVIERYERRIEIQVRTRSQQQWANAIEQVDSRFNLTIKDGVGPQSMLDYFSAAGAMLYYDEAALPRPDDVIDKFETATEAVITEGYFVRRRS